MRSARASVHPKSVAALKELIDWSQSTGSKLKYELTYTGTSMDDIQFQLIVLDKPNVVFMSGTAHLPPATPGVN